MRRTLALALLTLATTTAASPATLPAAELRGLLARCATYVHPETEGALVLAESSANPYALHDDATDSVPGELIGVPHACDRSGCGYFPRSRDEARAALRLLIARSSSLPRCFHGLDSCDAGVDVGIAQINSHNLAPLGLTLDDALDACQNLTASSALLRRAYATHGDVDRALEVYNSGRPDGAPDYVRRVRAAARTVYVREILADEAALPADAPERTRAKRASAPAAPPRRGPTSRPDPTRPDTVRGPPPPTSSLFTSEHAAATRGDF